MTSHDWLLQTPPPVVQSAQLPPLPPQAVSSAPDMQLPAESQHPRHVVEQSFMGGLQTLMGRVGSVDSGPHVSPVSRHSAADAQSCIGPIEVGGQNPAVQTVAETEAPQQTSPGGQSLALVQMAAGLLPLELPPLLALLPMTPLLLNPPLLLLNPPLLLTPLLLVAPLLEPTPLDALPATLPPPLPETAPPPVLDVPSSPCGVPGSCPEPGITLPPHANTGSAAAITAAAR